jgi:hypothetical protein
MGIWARRKGLVAEEVLMVGFEGERSVAGAPELGLRDGLAPAGDFELGFFKVMVTAGIWEGFGENLLKEPAPFCF